MCGTKNSQDATTCKSCGYTFEQFSVNDAGNVSDQNEPSHAFDTEPIESSTTLNTEPMASSPSFDTRPMASTPPPTVPTGVPLFTISKSILGSIIPLIIYILFIGLSGLFLSLYFAIFIAIFVLMTVVPMLTSPRKFEFYSDSLRLHKIVGGDSEILYSNMTLYEYPRRGQIGLIVEGQRRPIVVSGNPMNSELNQNLKQFLEGKLKKFNAKPETESQPESSGSSYDNESPESTNDTDTTMT